MASQIQFPQQNEAFTCQDIPGCETLHVRITPDEQTGWRFLSAHRLSAEELAEVARTGIVYLGQFGDHVQPIKIYGKFPSDLPDDPDLMDVGYVTPRGSLAELLNTCRRPAEFVDVWGYMTPAAQAQPDAREAYRAACYKWPGKLYPYELLGGANV